MLEQQQTDFHSNDPSIKKAHLTISLGIHLPSHLSIHSSTYQMNIIHLSRLIHLSYDSSIYLFCSCPGDDVTVLPQDDYYATRPPSWSDDFAWFPTHDDHQIECPLEKAAR